MNEIEKEINKKIENFQNISLKAKKIVIENENYIIKKSNKELDYLYDYLHGQNVNAVLYPVKKIQIKNSSYYLYNYLEEINTPPSKKIYDLKEALRELHHKTQVLKTLKKANYKYLYRIYKKLDAKFKILEYYIREYEAKPTKDDTVWIILSKYYIFLDCKKELYRLQRKIHKAMEDKTAVYFALNHENPHLFHIINKIIVSLDNAKIGFISSDIAKVYILNEYINIDWEEFIKSWLDEYEGEIYKVYFKFLVLYIFILNVDILGENVYANTNSYIQISQKIQKFMKLFKDY